MRLKLYGNWEIGAIAAGLWGTVAGIGRTLRLTVENDAEVERRLAGGEGQILVTWHGRTIVPLFHFRGRGLFTIISPSRDGEIQYRLYRRFGWDAVRGSSGRDAAKAALASVRKLRDGATLALTPDGPKGPAGSVQPGTFYMARKSGCPIVPAGISASPAWRLKSWDSFLVPKPYARAVIIFGEPVFIAPDASEETVKEQSLLLGQTIESLQRQADILVGREDVALAHV